jgi:streptogramin lyase
VLVGQRSLAAAVALLASLLAAGPGAASAGPISEYTAGLSANGSPTGIVAGPDGNLWFTEGSGGGAIGSITPSGAISEYSAGLSAPPQYIALGPDGNLWFTEAGNGAKVGRINPTTHAVTEFSIPSSGSNPAGLAAGPDGYMWFAESGGTAKIARINPTTGAITEFSTGLSAGSMPTEIAWGPDGSLWFTENANPGAIGRLDPNTATISTYSAGLTKNSGPWGITAGRDGNMWFTESKNRVGRITATGVITEYPTGFVAGTPQDIAAGSDGNLYFTETTGAVAQVTTSGVVTEFTTGLSFKAKPWELVSGPDGNIWFTEHSGTGAIGMLKLYAPQRSAGGPDQSPRETPAPAVLASQAGGWLPQEGASALLHVVAGSVFVRSPGSLRFVPLTGARLVSQGATIDATAGVVDVTTTLDGRHTQTARVWGGRFSVRQSAAGHGLTEFLVPGVTRAECRATGGAVTSAHSARARRAPQHKLWVSDHHGHYSTRGQNSVATVLGTRWLTVNSCAGTLTRVTQGRVRVTDLRHHRRVLVKARHSYLARFPTRW